MNPEHSCSIKAVIKNKLAEWCWLLWVESTASITPQLTISRGRGRHISPDNDVWARNWLWVNIIWIVKWYFRLAKLLELMFQQVAVGSLASGTTSWPAKVQGSPTCQYCWWWYSRGLNPSPYGMWPILNKAVWVKSK